MRTLTIAAALAFALIACGEVADPAVTDAPIEEAAPVEEVVEGEEPTQAPPTDEPEQGLPGLTHGYIRGLADIEGFECETSSAGGFGWYCTKESGQALYNLQSFGPGASTVTAVGAGVTMKDGSDPTAAAMPFLPLIASIEYEGASPEAALQWTQEAAGQSVVETDFGPAHYIVRWDPSFGTATLDIESK